MHLTGKNPVDGFFAVCDISLLLYVCLDDFVENRWVLTYTYCMLWTLLLCCCCCNTESVSGLAMSQYCCLHREQLGFEAGWGVRVGGGRVEQDERG